jgi:glutaredoxin 1
MTVEVYSKDGCPFCVRAKNLLKIKGFDFTEYKIGEGGIDKEYVQNKAGKPVTTVPQIFINGNHVGGFTDLEQYFKNKAA